jgi:outer membrane receptor protein involved in Fe transport
MSISARLLQGVATAVLVVAVATPAQAQVFSFSIPAGSLKGALDAFGKQSGKQVIYRVEDVSKASSPGVNGRMSAEDALRALLVGSGFTPRIDPTGAIAIVRSAGSNARQTPTAEADSEILTGSGNADATIVVTGTRIQTPNADSVVPITSVSGEEFFQTGQVVIGEVLNELPALRSSVTQNNSFLTDGTGINMLDLRGLGVNRTLVLQNGRRHVPGSPYSTAADVNTMPADLIERVDIITGGSSAVYGSDAIAGVVNFVLKRDYEGIQVRGQGGVSKYGDAGRYYASALAGTNFADGRGNIAVNLEYTNQEDVYYPQRSHLRTLDGWFFTVDSDPPGTPNGSDGIPDRILMRDIRYWGVSNSGQYVVFDDTPEGLFPAYNFAPDGRLVLQTGDRSQSWPFYLGGNGDNTQEGKKLNLVPRVDRYAVNLLTHFTVSEAFEPFIEAKYVHTKALGASYEPFFTRGFWGPRESYYTDNPFLIPETRDFIRQSEGLAEGEEAEFFFRRNFLELGARQEDVTRKTYRIVAGARGEFNDDWRYEITANVAQVKSRSTITNDVNVQRYLLAIDAVRDPATGQIVCRSQIDPSAAIAYEGARDQAYAEAQLAQDVAQCVPLNPFGQGNISQGAKDYIYALSTFGSKVNQTVLNGFISGDSSDLFLLPGGPISFAAGAEYRHETYRDSQSEPVQAGLHSYTGFAPFTPPALEVKEIFGELRVPLIADRPGFEELTLKAAGRLADYNSVARTVVAWNGGAEWTPVRDLRFRANYSRAVRAPNVEEAFTPLQRAFRGGVTEDPCSIDHIGAGSPNRPANCQADGVPQDFDLSFYQGFEYRAGGNSNLREESSDSITVGAIIQPRWIPGFSLSLDYYDIKVTDVITSPGVQAILNSCYDSSSIENDFCRLFDRYTGTGPGPNGEIPGQIIPGSLHVVPVNHAALKVRGIDFEARYRRQINSVWRLSTRLLYTLALQNDSFLDPEDLDFADQNLLELGNPKHALNWSLDLTRGPVTLGYKMRYFSKMTPGEVENIHSVQGRPPQNADAFDIRYLPEAFYHDLRMGVRVNPRFNFYVGVDNVTNSVGPIGISPVFTSGGNTYNSVGRLFYAGAVARF